MSILQRYAPHFQVPGLVTPQVQSVDFKKYLGANTHFGSLAFLNGYITTISNINSEVLVGQQWGSSMAKSSYMINQIPLSVYTVQASMEYDVEEQARFEALSNGVSLPSFLEDLARQGINQQRHIGTLLGFEENENQGVVGNATQTTFPSDSQGVDTIIGYDIAELQAFLASQARAVMDATYGMAKPVVIASSVRIINYLKSAIVPLTDSQKDGAGIDSIGGVYGRVVGEWLGVGKVEFIADDLLKDDNNGDKIVFIAPGIDNNQGGDASINQNLVGKNNLTFNTMMDDGPGVMRFDAPPSLGRYQSRFVCKMTPGVTIRSEAVIVCSNVLYS